MPMIPLWIFELRITKSLQLNGIALGIAPLKGVLSQAYRSRAWTSVHGDNNHSKNTLVVYEICF